MSSDTEGVWVMAWTAGNERAVAWVHYTGALWAWRPLPDRWVLTTRPVGCAATLPDDVDPHSAPADLRAWAREH